MNFDFNIQNYIMGFAMNLPGILLAMVAHEFAHGAMANRLGDPTAKMAGRLSFNPIVHMDMLGSVILPIVTSILLSITIGWAKPVPINPRYFKNIRRDIFWVSFAGPLANFFLLILSALLYAIVLVKVPQEFYLRDPLLSILQQSVYINTIIGVFNLIPFPPLDGSKMVMSFMSYEAQRKIAELSRYSMIFFMIIMFTGVLRYVFYPALTVAGAIMKSFIILLQSL